jgi:hypothetical protein
VRVTKLASLALFAIALSACTSITPQSTPFVSTPITPLPGSSLLPSLALPTVPLVTVPPESILPSAEPPSIEPATPTPTTKATRTPKPTKKPTPTPSPTPEGTPGDIEVNFEPSTIPDPFYNNTDYTIRVYIAALGTQDLPYVHVKMVAKNEAATFEFDTGPIAITDSYYHDIEHVNLPAIGPSSLILTATMPSGYYDTNEANNTKSVDIEVSLAP